MTASAVSPKLVWRALYVHRYGSQDEFLVDSVAPLVNSLSASGALHGFFFLRYWQGGHHIRLRLQVAEEESEKLVDESAAKLGTYLAEFPGTTSLDRSDFNEAQVTMAALEHADTETIHPPDTIRRGLYLPEHDKYGGTRGVAIAEELFESSSSLAIATLRKAPGEPRKRLGAGFLAMVRGLCATGRSPADAARFFAHYCLLWSPYIFDEFLQTWPELLRARRKPVRRHAAQALADAEAISDPFTTAMRKAWTEVRTHADAVLPAVTVAGLNAPRERREEVLLASYLHTHNNRLGLIPQQESFLGYLGHHVMSELAGKSPERDLMQQLAVVRRERLTEAGERP
jgi:thiopeptide-type bacteriocin biosynthesis protein